MVQSLFTIVCTVLVVCAFKMAGLIDRQNALKICFCGVLVLIPFVPLVKFCVLYFWAFALIVLLARGILLVEFELVPEPTIKQIPAVENQQPFEISKRPIFPEMPEISEEIELIIDNVLRDFVASWYQSLNKDANAPFLGGLRTVLDDMAKNMQDATKNINLPKLLILKMLPLITKHFKTFKSADKVAFDSLSPEEKANGGDHSFAVAVEFGREYKIHEAISLGSLSLPYCLEKYSREKAHLLLKKFLAPEELASPFVKIIGREVLCCCILNPLLQKFVNPDQWNSLIASICSTLLKERTQVREIRAALSTEVEGSDNSETRQPLEEDALLGKMKIDAQTDAKDFEDLLKEISSIKNKETLKAVKFSVLSQLLLAKKANELGKRESVLSNRLILALNMIDSRLRYLTTNLFELPPSNAGFRLAQINAFENFVNTISMDDIRGDKFCYRFFSEYLKLNDTKGDRCLKFWLMVQGFKNPLEDPSNDELAIMSDTDFEDLVKTSREFFSGRNLFIMQSLNEQCASDVSEFQKILKNKGKDAAIEVYQTARKSTLLLQALSYEFLDGSCFRDFKISQEFIRMISAAEFQNSNLYKRFVAVTDGDDRDYGQNSQNSSRTVLTEKNDSPIRNSNALGELRMRKSFSNLFGKSEGSTLFENKLFEDDWSFDGDEDKSSEEDADCLDGHGISNSYGDDSGPNLAIMKLNQSNLKNTIAELTISIDRLRKQLSLLNHLGLKADLTDSASELRLLKKSERAVNKEILQQELLRQQLVVQENANSLFKKCQLSIKTHLSDISQKSGREIIYYVISVSHVNDELITSWDIPRRYSEFYELNTYLKRRYKSLVKHLQNKDYVPEKVKMSLVYHVSKTLLYKERTMKLERFLRCLLLIPEICQDRHFRKFLTDTNTAFSIKERIENYENRKNILSRIDSVSSRLFESSAEASASPDNRMSEEESEAEALAVKSQSILLTDEEPTRKEFFFGPICDLFVALFSLKGSRSSWLRGRALLVVIQQLLGGTIEKYVKDSIDRLTSNHSILTVLKVIRSKLWIENVFFKKLETQEAANQKNSEGALQVEKEAKLKLEMLLVETCGRVVGLRNSREAGADIHAMLQNEHLNASLLLEVLDLVFEEIFSIAL
ncbi:LANO_0F13806g1_1 [Lachancea nothofagi CBS 11611]|uniref:LANO_0F13806g1_1 n=1 Tax=Lachancea nothofagi CBS 11611 TaxID=1266666 RepID=A0A1G4KC23_9SACH|nr:LANO_0F13806g1_1 [Lachancea nothofagi CBS 11611]